MVGSEKLHEVTFGDNYSLQIILKDFDGKSYMAHYNNFKVFTTLESERSSSAWKRLGVEGLANLLSAFDSLKGGYLFLIITNHYTGWPSRWGVCSHCVRVQHGSFYPWRRYGVPQWDKVQHKVRFQKMLNMIFLLTGTATRTTTTTSTVLWPWGEADGSRVAPIVTWPVCIQNLALIKVSACSLPGFTVGMREEVHGQVGKRQKWPSYINDLLFKSRCTVHD